MKKLLFIAAISLGVVVSANAQETKFGAKAGVNIATITGDDVGDDVNGTIGFQVGGYAHIGITDAFAIQPELLFDTKGAEDLTLSYITIPVLAKYMITEGFDIHIGPQIGLLMSADSDCEDASDFYKSTDFGLAAGAGYELESGINFSVRYSMSLGSIAEEFDQKNSVITIAVGYSF
jgi:hypothetical protein